MKINLIDIDKIVTEARFNPRYYNFLKHRDEVIANSKFQFIPLENKEYFPVMSDGIHSEVALEQRGSVKYLYVHSLKEGFIDITDNIFLNIIDHEKNKKKELKEGAVLLSVVGTLGHTGYYTDYVQSPCSLPRNIAYIYTNDKLVKSKFLLCFFLSDFSKKQSIYSGGGNIQGLLSLTKLKKFMIPIVDMKIQCVFEDKFTKALNLQKEFLEKINEAKEIFYKSLNLKKINFSHHRAFNVQRDGLSNIWNPEFYNPDSDDILNQIGKKFKVITIDSIISNIKKGDEIGSEFYNTVLEKNEEDIPFVRTSDIYNYEIDNYPDYYANKNIYTELNQDFKTGDLIFNNDGKIGYISIITEPDKAIYQSHIRRVRIKKNEYNIDTYYLFLCLLIPEIGGLQFKKLTVIQSTIPTLANRFKMIKIPVLDKNTILKISEIIYNAYQLIESKKKIIKEIENEINILF